LEGISQYPISTRNKDWHVFCTYIHAV